MDPGVASVIVALIGGGGLAGLFKAIFGGKSEHITDKEVEDGTVNPAYAFIVEQVAEMRKDLDEEREAHKETREAHQETREKVDAVSAKNAEYEKNILRLQWSLHTFITWAHDLQINWALYRLREDPPTPPDIQDDYYT